MVSLSSLQTIVSKYGSQFRGNSQHDALEFLLWLLDCVHEDVSLVSHNNNNQPRAPGKVRVALPAVGGCTVKFIRVYVLQQYENGILSRV